MKQPNTFDLAVVTTTVVLCVFAEHAFGLYGLVPAAVLLLFRKKHIVFFGGLSLASGIISDILFSSPIGMTTVVMNGALFVWMQTAGISRLRAVIFFAITGSATVLLSMLRGVHMQTFLTAVVLGSGWVVGRQFYAPGEKTSKLTISK